MTLEKLTRGYFKFGLEEFWLSQGALIAVRFRTITDPLKIGWQQTGHICFVEVMSAMKDKNQTPRYF